MKITIKKLIRSLRIQEITNLPTEPNQINYALIKPNPEIEENLFNPKHFPYEILDTLKDILHLRAQTYNLTCDIHPRTNRRKCTLCQEQNSLTHITQHCQAVNTERSEYNEAKKQQFTQEYENHTNLHQNNHITKILSMTATNNIESNINLLKITTYYINEIRTAQTNQQPNRENNENNEDDEDEYLNDPDYDDDHNDN